MISTTKIAQFRKLQDEVNEAKRYGVAFKFDKFEVCTEESEFGDYEFSEDESHLVYEWYNEALTELISEVQKAGYIIEVPLNDSVYIHNGNGKCISLRDHKVANSTMKHWNEIIDINFGESINLDLL